MKHEEYEMQVTICKYLSLKHPNVFFYSDTVAAIKLTAVQGKRNKNIQNSRIKTLDLNIDEPNNLFHGLKIELKKETPFKVNGELKKQAVIVKNSKGVVVNKYDHLEEQQKAIDFFNAKGYYACFAWSVDQAINIIENYLTNKIISHGKDKA